jgi:hypothetical protein
MPPPDDTPISKLLLSVGQHYHSDRSSWPEGTNFNYRSGEYELLISLPQPTKAESDAINTGDIRFALAVLEGIIFFCSEFRSAIPGTHSNQLSFDSPYTWHLIPREERTIPGPEPAASRALLLVILINATTGIVDAMRSCTLSPAFTTRLNHAIRAQATDDWAGPDAHRAAIGRIYGRYPDVQSLINVADVRCRGGD